MKKRDLFQSDRGDRDVVLRFLEHPQLETVVRAYLEKEKMEEPEYLLTRRYLMCSLLYKNAQRQGSVVNLRVEEQQRYTF